MNNVYILLMLAEADKTGVVYEKLMVASRPFYFFVTNNPGVGVALRESFLTMTRSDSLEGPYTSSWLRWRNYKGELHRKDGFAAISSYAYAYSGHLFLATKCQYGRSYITFVERGVDDGTGEHVTSKIRWH